MLEGQVKRGRGRPRKYPQKPNSDFETSKYDSFFNVASRKAEEGVTLNIQNLVENVFNSLYLVPYKDKLFSRPESYKDNYILNNLVNNEKIPEKNKFEKTCDAMGLGDNERAAALHWSKQAYLWNKKLIMPLVHNFKRVVFVLKRARAFVSR